MTEKNKHLQQLNNFVIFQTEKGKVNIEVYFKDDTLWLTQKLMSELFDKGRSTITEHLQRIFSDGELEEPSVCRDFRHTAEDGELKKIKLFENFEQLPKKHSQHPHIQEHYKCFIYIS